MDARRRRDADEQSHTDTAHDVMAALVDAVEDYAIFMLDAVGGVASWNAGAYRIKGYETDEIVGQHFSTFFVDDDISAGKPEQLLQAASEHGRVADEGWRVRKDGSHFWANVVITALPDGHGDVRGYLKVTRDDTDRRAAEAQARELDGLRDREVLARELNTAVINRITSASLALHGVRTISDDPAIVKTIDAALEELDRSINDLRTILFRFASRDELD